MTWLDNTSKVQIRVVPSDTQNLSPTAKAIHVGVAGDIHYLPLEGDVEITQPFAAGIWPIGMRKIFATGTTATLILSCPS